MRLIWLYLEWLFFSEQASSLEMKWRLGRREAKPESMGVRSKRYPWRGRRGRGETLQEVSHTRRRSSREPWALAVWLITFAPKAFIASLKPLGSRNSEGA